jgi:hypothetical protein
MNLRFNYFDYVDEMRWHEDVHGYYPVKVNTGSKGSKNERPQDSPLPKGQRHGKYSMAIFCVNKLETPPGILSKTDFRLRGKAVKERGK